MKICPSCASQSADNALFCTVCGTSLKDVQPAGAAETAASPEAISETTLQPTSEAAEPISEPTPSAPETAIPQPEVIIQPQQEQQNQQQTYQQYQQTYQQYDQNYQQQYQQNYQQQYQQYQSQPAANDHTADFDADDISSNKVVAMAAYLLGALGVIIAFLTAKDSPYAKFHAHQALKLLVVEALLELATAALVWTIIVPLAGAICLVILLVVRIICFFQVAAGKAKDAPIIGSFPFLK